MEKGWPSPRDVSLLAVALLLAAGCCQAADVTPAPAVPAAPVDAPRPVLTNALQINLLPADQIRLSNAVSLRGVMTFVNPENNCGFLQDETAGVAVSWTNSTPPASPGQLVEIEGTLGATLNTPIIKGAVFRQVGPGEFPRAPRASFSELRAGRADCQWVEVDGLVRSATMTSNHFLVLQLTADRQQRLKVSILSSSNLDAGGWVNSRVRIHGVACGLYNSKRQLISAELLVPSVDQARTVVAARSDPWSLPVTSLASLGHRSEPRPGEQIHIQGVMTLLLPGQALYVREGVNNIEVQTSETGGANPGDLVDVIGVYQKTDHALIIEDGSFRRLSSGPPPLPRAVTMEEIATGRADAELVTVPAVVLEWGGGNF
jgi:hypothetical protein